MARKRKGLARTAAVLVATALVEKAITRASEDPRIRRKAKAVGKALKKRAKAAGKKIAKAIKKRVPKRRRATPAKTGSTRRGRSRAALRAKPGTL